MSTLLEDLGTMAQVLDGLAAQHRAKGNLDGVVECEFQAARLRGHATRYRDEMERAREQRSTTADFGETDASRCLDALCRALERINGADLPPLAAAAIQESPCACCGDTGVIGAGRLKGKPCPWLEATWHAPPPADVEVRPPCAACRGRRRVFTGTGGESVACPHCPAPRALQGECKAWCGKPLRFMPEGARPYWVVYDEAKRFSFAYCSQACFDRVLPPLAAAAIQESPIKLMPGQRCVRLLHAHQHGPHFWTAERDAQRKREGNVARCLYVEPAPPSPGGRRITQEECVALAANLAASPPPADVEVPQRRECQDCNGSGSDASRYPISGCKSCGGDGWLTDPPPRPEAAPTCGRCGEVGGNGFISVPEPNALMGMDTRPCPDCTAPRALQGECKAWCGRWAGELPDDGGHWTRHGQGFCTEACRDAGTPLRPSSVR